MNINDMPIVKAYETLNGEYDSALETIEVLEGLVQELLAHAKKGARLYNNAHRSENWYFLWPAEAGASGHEDVNPLLLPFLKGDKE